MQVIEMDNKWAKGYKNESEMKGWVKKSIAIQTKKIYLLRLLKHAEGLIG